MCLPVSVNVVDYGADWTGVNDSTAAFQAALAVGAGTVQVPPGIFSTGYLVIPSNSHIVGAGPSTVIQPLAGVTGGAFWQSASGASGVEVEHLNFQWAGAFLPGSECLCFNQSSYCSAHDLTVSGGNMGIVALASSHITIRNNQVSKTGWFGICASGSTYTRIVGNHICDIGHEGINLTNTSYSIVSENFVSWASVVSQDFGISLSGQVATGGETSTICNMNIVQGNQILNSGKSGIALASDGTGLVFVGAVRDNTITLPNRLRLGLGNGGGGGVILYGNLCRLNTVEGNVLYDDGATAHAVYQWNQNGAPSSNNIGSNYAVGISGSNVG